jgi:hypothetical protein
MTTLNHLSDDQNDFCHNYLKHAFLAKNPHITELKESEKQAIAIMIKTQPELKAQLIAPLSNTLKKQILEKKTPPLPSLTDLKNTILAMIKDPQISPQQLLSYLKTHQTQLPPSKLTPLTEMIISTIDSLPTTPTTKPGFMITLKFHHILSQLLPLSPQHIPKIIPFLDEFLQALALFPTPSAQYHALNHLPDFSIQLLLKRLSLYQKIPILQIQTIYSKLYHQIKDDLPTLTYDKIKKACIKIGMSL